jgi:UDP-N-acetyl-2-amino-2-deoxyglucuronate dehydrogenase
MGITIFALLGAAGYIAPRHMRAIKFVGGDLAAAFDPRDAVGMIDSYFPDAHFFVEFERFDRYIDLLRRRGQKVDYMSVCSPNYLHDAHCRFALRSGADAICEKPLVLNPRNIEGLVDIESETGRRIHTILQLRLHPSIQALRKEVQEGPKKRYSVDLTYITSRGRWYDVSWKGDEHKSGGVATNIGIHFFDALLYIFGPLRRQSVHLREDRRAAGFLETENADIRWMLSVNQDDLPDAVRGVKPTYRSMSVDGKEVEFSEGFTDLHSVSYRAILDGAGFGLADARPSIEIVSEFREAPVTTDRDRRHPLLDRVA